MPETEAIFDEGRMAPRPESGLYGLPADEGGTSPVTPLLGSGPEEGRPAAPGRTHVRGLELAAILTMQVANRHTAFSPFPRFVPGR